MNIHGRSEGSRLFRKKLSCDIVIIKDLADLMGNLKTEMTLKMCSSFGKRSAGPFTSTHTPRKEYAMLGKVFPFNLWEELVVTQLQNLLSKPLAARVLKSGNWRVQYSNMAAIL